MLYREWGFGNPTFISSELDLGSHEVRVPGLLPMFRCVSWYVRVWIGRTVFIWDSVEGFKRCPKSTRRFKLVLGQRGE